MGLPTENWFLRATWRNSSRSPTPPGVSSRGMRGSRVATVSRIVDEGNSARLPHDIGEEEDSESSYNSGSGRREEADRDLPSSTNSINFAEVLVH